MQFITLPSRYPVAQIGDCLVAIKSDCSRPCELTLKVRIRDAYLNCRAGK